MGWAGCLQLTYPGPQCEAHFCQGTEVGVAESSGFARKIEDRFGYHLSTLG